MSEITADTVDEIFITHAFFADLGGDKQYDPAIDGEVGTISERQIEPVELEPGVTLKAAAVNGNAIQFGIMIGGITAVLLVVASLVAIRRQWSKA